MKTKIRLDKYLIDNNNVETRNKAQQLIKNGQINVNGKIIDKSNFLVDVNDEIKIIEPLKFVSRGGIKLQHAINQFNINLNDKIVLDIGASTGGFTDCCLKNGAKLVYCLDIGTNQLHHSLINNPSVKNFPNTNLKQIPNLFQKNQFDVIVVDVSFISLKHVFESIKNICSKNTTIVCLIKPQFELNPIILSKFKGSIKSEKYHNEAIQNVLLSATNNGFKLIKVIDSPILGSKGENKEFLGIFSFMEII